MDNINREMRNGAEIDNNIHRMDMEPDGNEYMNVRRKKVENVKKIEGLVQCNIQEQIREDKTTSSTERYIELSETSDKRSVSISNGTRQSEDTKVKYRVIGWNNDSKQIGGQIVEIMDKNNKGQLTRVIDQQNNNLHVNNCCITIWLGSDTDIGDLDRTETSRLLEQKGNRNDRQLQRNKCYLLLVTPFRASLQENARSSSLDMFRQHKCSLRYQEIESEEISERMNETSILRRERTLTINHNNAHHKKPEFNDRFNLEIMQIRRLYTEGRNDFNDLQDIELHATDRHFRNKVQQTDQYLCGS
ncbi:MAG: hypothetical protein EZS28_014219 [Streblomastix strix]|uniref:Uncharacterized protein n=1 Tax=Streblomastix strix TaxID=222440 RepID=A0A5J4W6W6_9EUKA|nr:MAG: hypothetical protein EZS28_014219 [Streblomastix strix]